MLIRGKASVRHVEYAEELSQAVETVFAQLDIAMVSVGIMNTEDMRRKLSKLFTQVFTFLREAMRWWASKTRCMYTRRGTFIFKELTVLEAKFADALSGDLQKSLRHRISEIERLSKDLRESVNNAHMAESRDHRLTSEEIYTIVRDNNAIVRNNNNATRRTQLDIAELKEVYKRQNQVLSNFTDVANRMNQALVENLHEGKYQVLQTNAVQGIQELSESKIPA